MIEKLIEARKLIAGVENCIIDNVGNENTPDHYDCKSDLDTAINLLETVAGEL